MGWQTAELIEMGDGDGSDPQVAIGQAGSALAVWREWDGTRINIWANRYISGSGWQTAELIEMSDGNGSDPQVAIGGDNNALAVWGQWDGIRDNIWANRYVSGLGWQMAEMIEMGDGNGSDLQVAIGGDNNALAVWRKSDGTKYNIWVNRYVSGSGWGTAELIETDDGYASDPQVAIGQDGNALVVWGQSDGIRNNIWARRYDEQ